MYVTPVTSDEFIFVYAPPLTVPRYTLYPETVDVVAVQLSAAECCTGTSPVPDRVTVTGEPVALLTMDTLPLLVPAVLGLYCTVTVTL